MRLVLTVIIVSVVFFCSLSSARTPPFGTVTITGETKDIYNKISFFEKGSSKGPLKTEPIEDLTEFLQPRIPASP